MLSCQNCFHGAHNSSCPEPMGNGRECACPEFRPDWVKLEETLERLTQHTGNLRGNTCSSAACWCNR